MARASRYVPNIDVKLIEKANSIEAFFFTRLYFKRILGALINICWYFVYYQLLNKCFADGVLAFSDFLGYLKIEGLLFKKD